MEHAVKAPRKGEKIGWTIGWIGAFCWIPLMGLLQIANGAAAWGVATCLLAGAGLWLVVCLSPWKHPQTPLWKLMAPVYLVLLGSAGLLAFFMQSSTDEKLEWYTLLWLIPVLLPLITIGGRRWDDAGDRTSR